MKKRCRQREEFYSRLGNILLKELSHLDISRGVSVQKRMLPKTEDQPMIF